jgi:hypothetical protein
MKCMHIGLFHNKLFTAKDIWLWYDFASSIEIVQNMNTIERQWTWPLEQCNTKI